MVNYPRPDRPFKDSRSGRMITVSPPEGPAMRHPAWALAAVAAVGCHRAADTQPAPTTAPTVAVAQVSTTMPAVPAHPTATGAATPATGLPGIFKPIPDRSTDDLLLEVEAPGTRDRLPLLAELANRAGDR